MTAKNNLLTYASAIDIPGAPQGAGSIDFADDDGDESEAEFRRLNPIKATFGAHHLLWLKCLQSVEDGTIKNLLGMMPPGSAKSTYTSIVFPTHYMGRFDRRAIIVASYGDVLPKKFGRRARAIVKQPIYNRIFGASLSSESAAVDEWALTNGSEWMAAGILTGITGNRADGVIWDDLIKGREQAESEAVRNKTWDAYMDDLMTRKKPHAFEIGINTRWHEDDPAGRILPENYSGESGWIKGRDGKDWYVVCLTAECDRADDILGRKIGEILWPEWFTPEYFAPFKRNARTWNALFQQRPSPESGDYFHATWLKHCPSPPHRDQLTIYGASDYAVTQNGGDYTVHVIVGIDKDDQIYLLDLWRQQATPDIWIESLCDLAQKWRPAGWAEETGQIKSSVGPFLQKRLRERRIFLVRAQFPARTDKAVRAQSIRGRMAMNGLHVDYNQPWFPAFKAELMMFNNGKYDDQVDAISLVGQVLDRMIPGSGVPAEKPKPKVFSTHPGECTVTLTDMWDTNERKHKGSRILRIK